MSDISLQWAPLALALLMLLLCAPGLIVGALIGAFAWRGSWLIGALLGGGAGAGLTLGFWLLYWNTNLSLSHGPIEVATILLARAGPGLGAGALLGIALWRSRWLFGAAYGALIGMGLWLGAWLYFFR